MFNIFQYEKVNKNRLLHETQKKRNEKMKLMHSVKNDELSSQANLRRLEWAAKYLNSDMFHSTF